MPLWLIWLLAAAFLFLIEILSFHFVAVIFSLGAIVAGIVGVFTDNIVVQLSVFVLVSLLSLVFARPLLQKLFKINQEVVPSSVDAVKGVVALVTKEITATENGIVTFDGQTWTAKSLTGDAFEVNEKVLVDKIEGVKVLVKKYENN